jgi:hypothetical protein
MELVCDEPTDNGAATASLRVRTTALVVASLTARWLVPEVPPLLSCTEMRGRGNTGIPPLEETLASVVTVSVVVPLHSPVATSAPALEKNRDTGTWLRLYRYRADQMIAAAITERLLLDVICMLR